MITHLQKLKFQTHQAVVIVGSTDKNGHKFYHVIKMDKPALLRLDHDTSRKKKVDFKQYGEILFSGWGAGPSEKILQELEKMTLA